MNATATCLIPKQKFTKQHQFHHNGGQGALVNLAKALTFPLPVRRRNSASTLPTFTLPTLPELLGNGRL